MPETISKKKYVELWNKEVDVFDILLFCSDEKLVSELKETQRKLKQLIVKIAETKNLRGGL